MKIRKVIPNNLRKAFKVYTLWKNLFVPLCGRSSKIYKENKVIDTYVDGELDREGFVYILASGEEGTVHIDHVLQYNGD